MVFSSLIFLFLYLPIVLFIYYICPIKCRSLWLFIANLWFYGWGEPKYAGLMLLSITINYIFGMIVSRLRDDRRKAKYVLIVCIAINLALLAFFKYYNLIAETVNASAFGRLPVLNIALPIGISFYTFQNMSYPIDIYRGDAEVQKSYIKYGTYVALFPQLIAGPIVRYKDVAEQLNFNAASVEKFSSGVDRFVLGLGKKVLIANNLGMLWEIYSKSPPDKLTTFGAWLGIAAFTLQIYFDFSGYSDMAIGLGRMLGLAFLENFNYPYISKSITEFWRRWHISLGTWFRDYVYIPLGGNRKGAKRQIFNILAVWTLTGIWHGANWTFLLWGLYYAVFLILEKAVLLQKIERVPSPVRHIYVLIVVAGGWVVFASDTVQQAFQYYTALFGFAPGGFISLSDRFYLTEYLPLIIAAAVCSTPIFQGLRRRLPQRLGEIMNPLLIILIMLAVTAYLVDDTYNPFLYFRF